MPGKFVPPCETLSATLLYKYDEDSAPAYNFCPDSDLDPPCLLCYGFHYLVMSADRLVAEPSDLGPQCLLRAIFIVFFFVMKFNIHAQSHSTTNKSVVRSDIEQYDTASIY